MFYNIVDLDHDTSKRILLEGETDLLGVIANLTAEMQTMKANQATLQRDVARIQSKSQGGSTYVRWGRTTCPGNGTEQVYSGYTAGSLYSDTGAAVNYLCLSPVAQWAKYTDAVDSGAKIYGAEYQFMVHNKAEGDQRSNLFFGKPLLDDNVPCSVCRSSRSSVLMVPGRNTCLNGWNLEYAGYLAAGYHTHPAASEYVCLDANPDTLIAGFADQNGILFYLVEGICGSLECPPYENGRELTCAVCSK